MSEIDKNKVDRFIQKTAKEFVKIEVKQAKETQKLWQSKFGGVPYMPQGFEYPKNEKSEPMHLLAQINFAEAPKQKDFPEKGILQFYIGDAGDGLFGADFDNQKEQKNFRIVYHENITEEDLITDYSFYYDSIKGKNEDKVTPLNSKKYKDGYDLTFSTASAPIYPEDYRFNEITNSLDVNFTDEEEGYFYDEAKDLFSGHKIGGYPYFTQSDPRYDSEDEKYEVLLLQIDTDDADNDIMWGDCGVANFFITKKDLKNKDFSKVLYNWDCC